ncbi:hypothetical protein RJ639_033839 [Escallonia herrerae]|uniref:C2 NT-type domain-containing protein n=1 Tax=Escallonia herrerae TaxID=1293975 RepID=A0AA88WUV2_9ASTE|nr:hypothetical protein RJ639_033839 [Escallonia herrerae]
MFKSARWRSDKNKVKAVFRLQFHATQVSHLGGDSLMLSVIPADAGKPSVRLERTVVRDGSCYWEKPVYETVKFVREPRTGKVHERIYHFVVATGTSKFGVIGEVSIDFANYAEATKLACVSLPVKSAKSKAVLHVSIQRMQESADQREVEERDYAKQNIHDRSLKAQLSSGNTDGSIQSNDSEDRFLNNATAHVVELKENRRTSSGSEVTLSSLESSSGLDTPRELGMKNNNIHEDDTSFMSSLSHVSVPQNPNPDASTTVYEEHQRAQWEWLGGSAPDASTDDSSSSPRETLLGERSQEAPDIVFDKLKTELAVLARQVEVSELELQTLRKQIVKEGKRGQDLSREIVRLKEERDAFKEECEKLQAFQKRLDEAKIKNKLQFEGGDPLTLFEELRQELNYEKNLNANLRVQLQKTQESNSELILAVRDLDEMLEQKDREMLTLSNNSAISESAKGSQGNNFKCETDDDEEQKALEELVKEHSNANDAYQMEQKLMDLYSEIEMHRREKDELEMQMEQLALDYEILKQENHDMSYKLEQSQLQEQLKMQYECSTSYATLNELETQIENLENELRKQSKDFSDSLVTINELEAHVRRLEEELEKQEQGFEVDLEALTRAKVEQEQRAVLAEESLRKTRLQNANTAERLQEEFRKLSMQMASTFDANEKLASSALTEANELRLQKSHLEDMFQKAKEEIQSVRNHYERKLLDLSRQVKLKTSQMEQMQSGMKDKSTEFEHARQHAEDNNRILSEEILMHRAEIERLRKENSVLSEQAEQKEAMGAELEKMKASVTESELLVEKTVTEKSERENMTTLVKMEAEKSVKQLEAMRSLNNEKESIVGNLQLELEMLKAQYNECKNTLSEDNLEKEKLRKQVLQLKADLKKKEDAFNTLEKKLEDSNSRATALEGTKATPRNNKSVPVPRGSKKVTNLKEKIKLLEIQIKLKEAALETSTDSFLEKEKDFQNKIEELEIRLEVLNQSTAGFSGRDSPKVVKEAEELTSNGPNGHDVFLLPFSITTKLYVHPCSKNDSLSEKELKASAISTKDLDVLLNEMAQMRERNKSMECELKDMQERYSEISLKFAEVEGERQQLVMTLRNVKNAKKS